MIKLFRYIFSVVCLLLLTQTGSEALDVSEYFFGRRADPATPHLYDNVLKLHPSARIRAKSFIRSRRLSTYQCTHKLFAVYYLNGLDGFHSDKVNRTTFVRKSSLKESGGRPFSRKGIIRTQSKTKRLFVTNQYLNKFCSNAIKPPADALSATDKSYFIFLSLRSSALLKMIAVWRT